MSINEVEANRPGAAREALTRQIPAAKAAGIKKMVLVAAGDPEMAAAGEGNGYYTWARYGYNAPVNSLTDDLQSRVKQAFPEAVDIQDIMATDNGRDWWRDNGGSFTGEFNLADDSRSMQVYTNYLAEKGELPKPKRKRTK